MEMGCFLCGPCRDVLSKRQDQFSQFCIEGCEDRTSALRQSNSHCWSRYQETSGNILSTLDCVL
jgi:hypothetical protein